MRVIRQSSYEIDLLLDNLDSLLATLTVEVIMGMFLPANLLWTMSNAQDMRIISNIAVIPLLKLVIMAAMSAMVQGFTATTEVMT